MNIKDKILELRNHIVRYGHIVDDHQYTHNGKYIRETSFQLEGQEIFIKMCNGEVLELSYN